jgi:iron complex outermembrane receptor protein
MKKNIFALGGALATIATSLPVGAQNAATNTQNNAEPLDEVVVTAERRRTNLQTTPIAATVLTGDALATSGVTTVDQLQFISPAATVNNFGQGIDFNIRGIGKAEHNTQTTTGVITYRDSVATFPGYFTAEPYYDIARVEILRGPQGTFVGQNATGGAVFVTSQDPIINGGYRGYLQGQVGNYDDVGAQGAINLPVSDTFAARLAFNAERRDSFYDITGPHTGDDGVRTGSVRLGVRWEPTANFSVLWKNDFSYLDLSGYPSDPVNSPNDVYNLTSNADTHGLDRFGRSVLKLDYEFANGATLRSVSGYQKGRTEYRADLDGTSVGTSIFGDAVNEEIYSQEINLISPDTGRFKWVLGAYYQHDEYEFPPGEFYIGLPTGFYRLSGTNPKETTAAFGQVSFGLTSALELQVGARYSDSHTTNHISVNQYGLPLAQDQKATYSNLSGKVALNWTVDAHNFLYAFVATGYRPGGLNVPVGLGIPAPFDEEKVTNYEIGWKAGLADGRVRTQVDAYYNDYENFQVTVGYPTLPVFGFELNNPSKTKIYGFEAQAEAAFGALSFDAGIGWLQSDLGKFFAVDPRAISLGGCDPRTGPSSPSCINVEGHDQTYAPHFTFNLGMQYDFALDGGGNTLTPRINYGHVSDQWATLFENRSRGDLIEARNILNAQVAWKHGDLVTTLYGYNLTDQHYVGAVNSGLRFAGAPRQFGLRMLKAF